jgi:hypothetical protein
VLKQNIRFLLPDVLRFVGCWGFGCCLFVFIALDGTTACEEAVVSLLFLF